jgi:hypothetical protein
MEILGVDIEKLFKMLITTPGRVRHVGAFGSALREQI